MPLKLKKRPRKKRQNREWSSVLNDTEEAREVSTEKYPLDLTKGRPL